MSFASSADGAVARQHCPEAFGERRGAFHAHAGHRLAEHAGRRLADRAAPAHEPDRRDRAVVEPVAQVDLVAAERVVRLDDAVRRVDRLMVARVAIVVEDDLAIEIVVDGRGTDCHSSIVVQRFAPKT